jgi:transglutaminase-like putative cysteine protease
METLLRLLHRRRPAEGWLLWSLALLTLLLLAAGVGAAGWIPHLGLLLSAVIIIAYCAGFWLSRASRRVGSGRPAPRGRLAGWWAAALLALLGALTVALLAGWREAPQTAASVPWLALPLVRGGQTIGEMAGRLAQWGRDLASAGRVEQDDAVFRWLLGMAAWAAAAWAAWWLYVRRQTLAAFLPTGVLLASNAFFYWDGRLWLPFFLAGVTLVAVLLQRHALEERWTARGMDYSVDVRHEVLASAGSLALLVMLAGFVMPSLALKPAANWFAGLVQAPVNRIEQAGQRAFPGLRRTPGALLATADRAGAMPRSHLLTDGPELGTAVVMRVSTDELAGLAPGEVPGPAMQHDWRGLTFDQYDGRGWRNSPLLAESFAAGEPWTEEPLPWRRPLRQWVSMERGGDRALYAAGEPLAANRPYELLVRRDAAQPAAHLAAMLASGRRYQVLSLTPDASEEVLRAAGQDYPPGIEALYLALPPLPPRVGQLALEVTAGAATPYDQALALETYLRQFPYDLSVSAPPEGRDAVDYFLFDLQAGYCDYYASAMVTMARSLGIPARLAVGYSSGAYDPNQRLFVVTEQNAHSWPELYFPQIGWVPFEPTASLAPSERTTPSGQPAPLRAAGEEGLTQVQADLQTFREDQIVRRRLGWLLLLAAIGVVGLGVWLLRRRRGQPGALMAYGLLAGWARRLGVAPQPGDTPSQLAQALELRLSAVQAEATVGEQVQQFVRSFEAAQYSPRPLEAEREARGLWPALERSLRRLWLRGIGRKRQTG